MTLPLKVLDLFSGIGAYSLGLQRAGMETVAFCEIDEWCRQLLQQNYPQTDIMGDIEEQTFEGIDADVIIGGFPCQDISNAGKRAGLAGERSRLFWEMVRAVRVVRPLVAIVENVAAILNRGNGMGDVLGALAEIRYDAQWDCISLDELGAPHGRPRLWLAATDSDRTIWANGSDTAVRRWQRSAQEGSEAIADTHNANARKGETIPFQGRERIRCSRSEITADANGQRQLQSPWVFGYVRRRIDDGSLGAFWSCDWQTQFEALRRMDVRPPTRLDRSRDSKAIGHLGNCNPPQIPQAIGEAILEAIQHVMNYAPDARIEDQTG